MKGVKGHSQEEGGKKSCVTGLPDVIQHISGLNRAFTLSCLVEIIVLTVDAHVIFFNAF